MITIVLVVAALAGGFVAGVLVGRANKKTVNTVVSDVNKVVDTAKKA